MSGLDQKSDFYLTNACYSCKSQIGLTSNVNLHFLFLPYLGLLLQKDQELAELKQKVAEAMALMPSSSYNSAPTPGGESPHFSAKFTSPSASPAAEQEPDVLAMSSLNPNASDYTPKTSSP